jgi:hypothetical protein
MNWVFPIAGHGTRTSSLGRYKPFIEIIPNHTILKLCLLGLKSLIKSKDRLVFITSEEQEIKYSVSKTIKTTLSQLNLKNKIDVVLLDSTPKGQALTVKYAIEKLDTGFLESKTFVVNSDQLVFFDIGNVNLNICSVGLYFNDGNASCFFDLDIKNRLVSKIREKTKISCYAAAGVFYFNTGKRLLDCINWAINENKFYKNELYLGPCMEYFKDLSYFQTSVKFDLGNVEKIKLFNGFIKNLVE